MEVLQTLPPPHFLLYLVAENHCRSWGRKVEKNQSLDRTLDILECFTIANPKIGLSELARAVALPKATVYRIAETLLDRGYLIKDRKDQSYQLGYKVLNLSNVMLSNLDYRQVALPYMKQIKEETNESITLYIALNSKQRLCVERVQSTNGLSRIVNVGDVFPIERGAPGKVLLAYQDPSMRNSDCRVPVDELETIRQQGYAISYAEREQGVTAVAAPILNQFGQIVAALSISGPAFRYENENMEKFIHLIKTVSNNISRALGYQE